MKKILLFFTIILPLWAADIQHLKKQNTITLVFDDHKEFDADINILKISQTLNNMFDDLGSGTEEQIPITNISSAFFIQALYPIMKIIHTHSDDSVMKKRINEFLQALDFDQIKDLLVAANFLDIPQLLPLVIDQFAGLIASDSVLKRFIEQPNFIQSLGIPNDLLNVVAQQLQQTVEMRKLLFKIIDPEPKITISAGATKSAFSSDGKTLATVSDHGIQVWNVTTEQLLHTLAGHRGRVYSVAFSHDGRTLAIVLLDGTITLWNLATGGKFLPHLTGHTRYVSSAAISPDLKTLASGSDDGIIEVRDVATGQLLHTLTGHTESVDLLAFSPDGKTLASGSSDRTTNVWSVATGELLHTFTGHTESIIFSPDGTTLVIVSGGRTVDVWDVATGQLLHTFTNRTRLINPEAFYLSDKPVDLSLDVKTLAIGSNDGIIKLWDVATGQLLHTFPGHTESVRLLALSPNGKTLASVSNHAKIKVWDVATEQLLHTFTNRTGSIKSVNFSPDGKNLAITFQIGTIELLPLTFDRLSLEIRLLIALVSEDPGSMNQENVRKNTIQSLASVSDPAIKRKLGEYFATTLADYLKTERRNTLLQKLLDTYNKTMNQFEGYQ